MHWEIRVRDCSIVVLALVVFLNPTIVTSQVVDSRGYRPHYQGFGSDTRGGRGGTIIRVTNLDDSGAGSFRAALTAAGPRIVIFEVSGTVTLRSRIDVNNPFLTVAGQTAPSPGIVVRNAAIRIDTHDVVVQHIRFRLGDASGSSDPDTFWIRNNAYNIVLDHSSFSWGVDETLAIGAGSGPQPHDISIFDSIIAESLHCSNNSKGCHSMGMLINTSAGGTMTMARNLLANNYERNPSLRPGWRAEVFNNVFYNGAGASQNNGFSAYIGGDGAGNPYSGTSGMIFEVAHVGNVAIAGPSTPPGSKPVRIQTAAGGSKFYLADNVGLGMGNDQWAGVQLGGGTSEGAVKASSAPFWFAPYRDTLPGSKVQAYVLRNAGARPRDRDPVDRRIVSGVANRTGGIINSQRDVGGWPVLEQNGRVLTPPSQPNALVDFVGRTAIEKWLEAIARGVELD